MPALQDRKWTEAEVRKLIDEAPLATPRYELVDGELLVTPGPTYNHQRVVGALFAKLRDFARANGYGELLPSPADIRLAPELIVQPDLFVLPLVDGRPMRGEPATRILLAIEVLSPSSVRFDRGAKRRAYQKVGVDEYWIVDPAARLLERWRPADERPEILDEELVWRPTDAGELRLDIASIFADWVDGED